MMTMNADVDVPLVTTRRSLHALAEKVISPLRVQATGNEIALRVRPEGFGTPDLPDGGWVGTAGTQLVQVDGQGDEKAVAITSLRAAARFVGLDDRSASELSDATLEVHAGAALILADAWARGEDALEQLAESARPKDDASPIHLWPEHFDIAIELGAGDARATYGVSPGDDDHDEPYAYVSPWTPPAETGLNTFWNAHGAERPADDPEEMYAFFREAARLLSARPPAGGSA
jgi:hypothetical protein